MEKRPLVFLMTKLTLHLLKKSLQGFVWLKIKLRSSLVMESILELKVVESWLVGQMRLDLLSNLNLYFKYDFFQTLNPFLAYFKWVCFCRKASSQSLDTIIAFFRFTLRQTRLLQCKSELQSPNMSSLDVKLREIRRKIPDQLRRGVKTFVKSKLITCKNYSG